MELGFAKASVPAGLKKNTIESELGPAILSAEKKAKIFRNGIWSDALPPVPFYTIYWRKATQLTTQLMLIGGKKLLHLLFFITKSALVGTKNLILRPFRASPTPAPKQIQAT